MLIASFFFSAMSLGVKRATEWFDTMELVGYRGLISGIVVWLMMRLRGETLYTQYPRLHFSRSVVGALSLGLVFYAISGLALATAATLNYTSGLWLAAIVLVSNRSAGRVHGEPLQGRRITALLIGLVGITLILQPTIADNQLHYGVVGLLSAIAAAWAYHNVAELGRAGEPETRIVFYFCLACAVLGFAGQWLFKGSLSPVPADSIGWLLSIGLLAALGQWAMTLAYSQGSTLLVANLQYSGVVFAALLGWIFLADTPGPVAWIGIVLVCFAAMMSTELRKQ